MKKSLSSALLVGSTLVSGLSVASAASVVKPHPESESMLCDYSNTGDDQEYCCTRKAKDAELCYSVAARDLPLMRLQGCADDDAARLISVLQVHDTSHLNTLTVTCSR